MSCQLQVQQILDKSLELEGLTFLQLARSLALDIPQDLRAAKGWIGQAVEIFLGAKAGCLPVPDFPELQLELKTIPINKFGQATESTYVTTLQLIGELNMQWKQSACFHKLQKILWIPIEGDKSIPYHQRRFGRAILWQPNQEQQAVLKNDWEIITEMVIQGAVEKIHGGIGKYLHIRPKAANSQAITTTLNEHGEVIYTLPRGYYLRSQLTNQILAIDNKLSRC